MYKVLNYLFANFILRVDNAAQLPLTFQVFLFPETGFVDQKGNDVIG